MIRRLLVAVAAAAAIFALVASSASAATKHRHPPAPPPSAYDVYVQQLPTASGPKPVGGTAASGQAGQTGQSAPYVPLSPTATATLKRQGGKDTTLLKTIATNPGLGAQGRFAAASAPSVKAPSAVSAAVGLGSGPTALFIVLIGGAVVLFAAGKLRGRRN